MKITKRRLIFKISTSRLKKAKWNLRVTMDEAQNNDEVIALGDSQVIRWIDELNGIGDVDTQVREIRSQIRALTRKEDSVADRRVVRELHKRLDELQFLPDYVHIVAGNNAEYKRAVKGFVINGIKFRRLVGTNGGLKNSTVVFVNERLVDELRRRIVNGHSADAKFVPGKYEAYRALVCSGSIPVSTPNGVIVVDDCMTKFRENIIMLNDEGREEPLMTYEDGYEIELDESDGYGLMSPELAERWSGELDLGYTCSGFCLRQSFTKGMVFTIDFHEFAEKVAGKYEIQDAWGTMRDVREAELILTTSQLKLWSAYDSMEEYFRHCDENHYTFSVTKAAPEKLENRRALNYQFIQSFQLDDGQVEELIRPTMEKIKDILSGDYRKALIFLCGRGMNERNIAHMASGKNGALMAEPEMFKDPHIKKWIYSMIRKRIDEAKIGVLDVHGNYSIVSGDPYALCQHIFGLEVTGLVRAGEIYNGYWAEQDAEYVACFRAPMSCHNNIKKMRVCRSADAAYWYRYIKTCTVLNCWDSMCAALNGCDKDGDLVMITDNSVLVSNIRPTRTIFCIQRNANKVIPTEDVLVASNLASFGDDIGKTTNKVTAMYDVQAGYEPGSAEYETLEYRIMSGQLYQQNCIDKIKGIVCNPMPRFWYDYHANALPDDPTEEDVAQREFNIRILADRKPYFMRYIYPSLMKQYKTYMKNVETKCAREFRISLSDLLAIPEDELTNEQREFIGYYRHRLPVGDGDCVMNRICRRFEEEFDGKIKLMCDEPFDYTIMKSGAEYTRYKYDRISKIYKDHSRWVHEFSKLKNSERVNEGSIPSSARLRWFRQKSTEVCSNGSELCDIILDMCYRRDSTKEFAWDVVSGNIIANLARRHGGKISFPVQDPGGDIEFDGDRFSMMTVDCPFIDTEEELFDGDRTEREGLGDEGN